VIKAVVFDLDGVLLAIPNRVFPPAPEALAKAAVVLRSLDELEPEVIEG